jgi:hypothetical protein
MASQVFKNCYWNINGVDLSASVQSLQLNYEAESLDETAMGADTRKMKGGLKNVSWDITLFQNYACVDATLFGLIGCQTSIEMRACNACSSAGNPIWEQTVMVQSYPPAGGTVGDLMTVAVRLDPAGSLRHCAVAS